MHRFFAPSLDPGDATVALPREESEHLTRVLRLGVGDAGGELLQQLVEALAQGGGVGLRFPAGDDQVYLAGHAVRRHGLGGEVEQARKRGVERAGRAGLLHAMQFTLGAAGVSAAPCPWRCRARWRPARSSRCGA